MPARLEHANLTVPDIDAAIAFLRTLDPAFEVLHDDGSGARRWAHVGTGDTYIALFAPDPGETVDPPRTPYVDKGVNHLGLVVDDVAAAADRLTAAGYREGYQAEEHPARLRRYFHDAAGLEWELVEYLTEDRAARFSYN